MKLPYIAPFLVDRYRLIAAKHVSSRAVCVEICVRLLYFVIIVVRCMTPPILCISNLILQTFYIIVELSVQAISIHSISIFADFAFSNFLLHRRKELYDYVQFRIDSVIYHYLISNLHYLSIGYQSYIT